MPRQQNARLEIEICCVPKSYRAPRKIAPAADLCESRSETAIIRGGQDGAIGVLWMRTSAWRHCLRRAIRSKQFDRLVPWETFRADIEAVVLTPEEMRKSSAGRKPLDAIVMFECWFCRRSTICGRGGGVSGA